MRTRCSERKYGAVNLEKCRRFVRQVKRDHSLKRAESWQRLNGRAVAETRRSIVRRLMTFHFLRSMRLENRARMFIGRRWRWRIERKGATGVCVCGRSVRPEGPSRETRWKDPFHRRSGFLIPHPYVPR